MGVVRLGHGESLLRRNGRRRSRSGYRLPPRMRVSAVQSRDQGLPGRRRADVGRTGTDRMALLMGRIQATRPVRGGRAEDASRRYNLKYAPPTTRPVAGPQGASCRPRGSAGDAGSTPPRAAHGRARCGQARLPRPAGRRRDAQRVRVVRREPARALRQRRGARHRRLGAGHARAARSALARAAQPQEAQHQPPQAVRGGQRGPDHGHGRAAHRQPGHHAVQRDQQVGQHRGPWPFLLFLGLCAGPRRGLPSTGRDTDAGARCAFADRRPRVVTTRRTGRAFRALASAGARALMAGPSALLDARALAASVPARPTSRPTPPPSRRDAHTSTPRALQRAGAFPYAPPAHARRLNVPLVADSPASGDQAGRGVGPTPTRPSAPRTEKPGERFAQPSHKVSRSCASIATRTTSRSPVARRRDRPEYLEGNTSSLLDAECRHVSRSR